MQDTDRLPTTRILQVIGVTLVVATVAVVVSAFLGRVGGEYPPKEIYPPAPSGTLSTSLLPTADHGGQVRREQRAILQRYGWVDREHGIAHIPIARAMDLVLERKP